MEIVVSCLLGVGVRADEIGARLPACITMGGSLCSTEWVLCASFMLCAESVVIMEALSRVPLARNSLGDWKDSQLRLSKG